MVTSLVKAGVSEKDATEIHNAIQSGGVAITVHDLAGVDTRAALQAGNPVNVATMG